MREFFRGWRRKVGVLTLGLACMCMGLWIRGLSVLDYFEVPVGRHSTIVCATYNQTCALLAEHDPDFDSSSAQWLSKSTAQFAPDELAGASFENLKMGIKYRNHPPIVPKGPNQPIRVPQISQGYWLIGMPISYWLVIPLTLISIWLLVVKPVHQLPSKLLNPSRKTSGEP